LDAACDRIATHRGAPHGRRTSCLKAVSQSSACKAVVDSTADGIQPSRIASCKRSPNALLPYLIRNRSRITFKNPPKITGNIPIKIRAPKAPSKYSLENARSILPKLHSRTKHLAIVQRSSP